MNRRWITVINLSVVSAFVFLGLNVVSPILPQYAMTFNVPVALTGWVVSSFALARVITDLPAGITGDKYGAKRVMITGLVIVTFSSVIAGLAPSYLVLIVARLAGGMGSALYITCAWSWLAQVSEGQSRGKMMGTYSSMLFIGVAAGPAIGGFAAAYFGIQAPFYIYALLTIVGILATIPLSESIHGKDALTTRYNTGHRRANVATLLSNRSFMIVSFSFFALFFLRSSVRSTLLPLYASINLGLGEDQIGLLMTVALVGTGLLSFPSGWISDKVGRKTPAMLCVLSSALLILLIPFQQNLQDLATLMIFIGAVSGLQGSMSAWPADIVTLDKLGTAIGLYRLIADLGIFLGPIAVTYANDWFNPNLITPQPFLLPATIAIIAGIALTKAADPSRGRLQ